MGEQVIIEMLEEKGKKWVNKEESDTRNEGKGKRGKDNIIQNRKGKKSKKVTGKVKDEY